MSIRRISAVVFIVGYLSCLTWGIGAHALKMGLQGNTIGYYFVWDMFCGWAAYDNRTHIIAEGSSGQYYEVNEPWGEFHPFGNVARINYDVSNSLISKHINNVLRHTAHEQIDRVYVVEEVWPKQYNVPERLWNKFYNEPRDKVSYFNVRAVCTAEGNVISSRPGWFDQQTMMSVSDNPRLKQVAQKANPFYSTFINPMNRRTGAAFQSSGSLLNTN
jgi:uncharacterized membrane protein